MKNFKDIFNNKPKNEYVHEMFDSLAVDYDLMNNIISLGQNKPVKKQVIKNVSLSSGMKILDVCTGTGDFPIFITQKLGESIEIIGVDFSEKMLEIARKKNQKYKNIEFINVDALNLPFNDSTFDAVFIGYGLRNLSDLKKGILEFKRVTKKGGYLVNLDMGKPKGLVGYMFKLYFFNIVPLLGKFIHGSSKPYVYLPESCEDFPDQNKLVEIFYELGFSEVKNYNFAFGALAQQVAKV